MREQILSEIRRLAAANGGQPPGAQAFTKGTGIRRHEWLGVFWARWGDALTEAGFTANEWQRRFDTDELLEHFANACRHLGHVPVEAELRIYGKATLGFPGHSTFTAHFGGKLETIDRLREWVTARPAYRDVAAMLGPKTDRPQSSRVVRTSRPADGYVYLIRSGDHHKIGQSEQLERRVKEIRVALPAAAVLEHAIRTDDPSGIEGYWHRRFADRRANGEWFKLTPADVAAFKRRVFQ
jgi:hypothetical protein